MSDDDLAALRSRIGAADRAVLDAVNERLRLVDALWRLKEESGLQRRDPAREESLLAELSAWNQGPLSDEGLVQLMREILALTKRELGDSTETV